MNFFSRTKPSLVGNVDISQMGGYESANDPPVKDIVTSGLNYIYDNFIKDNFVWIVLILIFCVVLYHRGKKDKTDNKKQKERFNTDTQHLVTLNPLQRKFNGQVVSLPNDIEMSDSEPYPAMNHTPYNFVRASNRADQRTGSINPYAYFPDSTVNNYMGYSPDYLSTTSSFGNYYTDKNKKAVLDLRRLMSDRDKLLENNLMLGPASLPNVKDFEPPYASD